MNEGQRRTTVRGVFAPALTPFLSDLTPNTEAYVAHCQWILRQGCGLVPFGTTGEGNSLSVQERVGLLATLVEARCDPQRLLPGTGCCALTDTIALSRKAAELGCAGVLMLPPFYYKNANASDDGLYRYIAEVIERVGSERLRIYLYHIPPIASVGFSLPLMERLVTHYPATVVGLKDSSGDFSHTETVLRALPQLAVFVGSERYLRRGMQAGGAGCISATVNVNPAAIRTLFDRWDGPEAPAMQGSVDRVRSVFEAFPMISALKRLLADRLDAPHWSTVRPPLLPLADAAAATLHEKLRATDFPSAAVGAPIAYGGSEENAAWPKAPRDRPTR